MELGMNQQTPYMRRKVIRIQNFDYASPHAYFITICTRGKECIFGSTKVLSPAGEVARQELECLAIHHPQIQVDQFVVMPNHIHAIIRLLPQPLTLQQLVGLYKAAVSRITGSPLWQRSFYEHVICDQAEYDKIWTYIQNNPLQWELDRFYR